MTVSALLARLRPLGGFLVAHWRPVAVAALAVVAALGVRGCASWRGKAEGAEAQATAAQAQLKAQFAAALWEAKRIPALAAVIDTAQKDGAAPAAVFSGHSERQIVPSPSTSGRPAARDQADVPVAASAGAPPFCVLVAGDSYEFHMVGAMLKRADRPHREDPCGGADCAVADVSIDLGEPTRLTLHGIVNAPVTLPPIDLAAPGVEIQRARLAGRLGIITPWAPSGAYLGGGVRVIGPWWLEADGRVEKVVTPKGDETHGSIGVGVRREW